MKVIAFIEPPQGAVVEKILRHCGLWHPSSPRAPPAEAAYDPDIGVGRLQPLAAWPQSIKDVRQFMHHRRQQFDL